MTEAEAKTEEYSVALFFPDGSYVYEARGLDAEAAVMLAKRCIGRPAAMAGFIRRVIVTDEGDFTCFDWRHGQGIVYPRFDPVVGRFVGDDSERDG